MASQTGYTLSKWNGKYGASSRFIAVDNSSGKQSMFTPGETDKILWTRTDLSNLPEVKDWQDFGEHVPDLESVAF